MPGNVIEFKYTNELIHGTEDSLFIVSPHFILVNGGSSMIAKTFRKDSNIILIEEEILGENISSKGLNLLTEERI